MAVTSWSVNHPLARKHWSDELVKEALQQTQALKFLGTDDRSIFMVKPETQKDKGDKVTFGLRVQMVGDGVSGDNTLEGNEESLQYYNDNLLIDGLRHAVRVNNFMGAQRVPFEVRQDAKNALADWLADRIDQALFNQLAGATHVTDTRYTASNATTAPTNLLIWDDSTDSNHTLESSLSESDVFTLRHIDYAVEKAKTLGRTGNGACPIRPVKYQGEELYVCFAHPIQIRNLRQKTGATHFYDLQRALLEGGQGAKQNPIFKGGSFMYNNTIVHESTRMPYGQSAAATAKTTYRRAVFCGAQAAVIAFGKGYAGAKADWTEETFDYGKELGVSAALIWGAKASVFNSLDFGRIVIPTYAAAAF